MIRPFVNQSISDQNDASFVQDGRNASRTRFRACVEHVVNRFEDVCRFTGRTSDEAVTVTMSQHQCAEHMAVAGCETVDIAAVKAFALKALIQKLFVLLEVLRVARIDDFNLVNRIGQALLRQQISNFLFTTDDKSLAHAAALILNRCTENAWIIAFGKDNGRLSSTCPSAEALQDARSRIHSRLQRQLVSFHVNDRTTRNARVHTSFGNGGWDAVNQTRVKRRRNDIITAKGQLFSIGHSNFVRHIFTSQFCESIRTSDLHLVVDRTSIHVERTTEQIREAQNVVHLVRIVRTPRRNDCILTNGMCFFRRNLWIRVRHRENNRVRRHACNHLGGHGTFGRNAQEHVSAIHRIREGAGIRGRSVSRLPLVHTFGTAFIDHALGVAHDAVVMLCAHRFDQF